MKRSFICRNKADLELALQCSLALNLETTLALCDEAANRHSTVFTIMVQVSYEAVPIPDTDLERVRHASPPAYTKWKIICTGGVKHRRYELIEMTNEE